jgi:hypothetical protein
MVSLVLFYMTFVTTIFMSFRQGVIYVFVLYQGYYFFNPETKWWGASIPDISYSFFIVLTMLIVVVFNWKKYASNKIMEIPQLLWFYVVVLLYGIASSYAVLPTVHSGAFDALLTIAVIVTLGYKIIQTEKQIDIVIGAYMMFAGYIGYYIGQFGRIVGGRFEGAGMVDAPDANGLAAALAPALLFCLYYFWMHPNWKMKIASVIVGGFVANGLVFLGSRGSFLGVAAATAVFVFYMFFSSIKKKHQRLSAVAIVVMGLAGVVAVTDDAFWERMQTIKSEGLDTRKMEEGTGGTRVLFWLAAIEMSKDHPFGGGASAFIYYSPQYISENVNTGSSRHRAVHSTWFEVLAEIGYPGLIAFGGMILYSFITIRRTMKHMASLGDHRRYFKVIAVGTALICFCVTMTFVNRFRAEILYWCLLYTGVIYNVYVLKSTKAEKDSLLEQS